MRRKSKFLSRRALPALMSLALTAGILAGCGGGGDGGGTGGGGGNGKTVVVEFMYGSSESVNDEYAKLINEFNNTVGKEKGVSVKGLERTYDGLQSSLTTQLTSPRGPDVVTLEDEWFKPLSIYLEPLDGLVSDEIISKLYPNSASREYFNAESLISEGEQTRFGFPFYSNTAVLFVNTAKLKEAGVVSISVAPEDLEAFNSGSKDGNGKTKSDYGITAKVLSKGFQRERPYVDGVNTWSRPASGEVMIFNDKIPMTWDEAEDLGRIMSRNTNPASPTDYGFYTEWWFNYGWSVGGDCLLSINGDDHCFGLTEDYSNYIVNSGKTYTGAYTGRVYSAGETLEFMDKVDVAKNQKVVAEDDGSFTVNGSPARIRPDVANKASDGTLSALPSTKTAFTRFAKLAAKEYDSTRISPYPTEISSAINYFVSDKIAMVIERSANFSYVASNRKDKAWTVAIVPCYREYQNPTDGSSDVVKAEGKIATHSHMNSIALRKGTTKKKEAGIFLEWMLTEGQKIMAKDGFGTVNSEYEQDALSATNISNPYAYVKSLSVAHCGDWMYLKDRRWIDNWASALNSNVRNGLQTLDNWYRTVVKTANEDIAGYRQ